MSDDKKPQYLTHATGTPVTDNLNILTAGARGPALLQDIWLIEKLAHFDREVIPERRMHAKGAGAHGTFTVTHDITRYTKAKIFSEIGKQTPMFARFSTVAGERGAADAERDIRGTALSLTAAIAPLANAASPSGPYDNTANSLGGRNAGTYGGN